MTGWLQTVLFWTSPAFPVGAFSYSHALEWLVETGQVKDRADLETYIRALITFGDLQADAAYLAAAHRCDPDFLPEILEDAPALRGAGELASESTDQGRAFVKALAETGRTYPRLEILTAAAPDRTGGLMPHSVAFGAAAHDAGIPIEAAVESWLHAAVANLVSAGQRLVPLGQRDGVAAIAGLKSDIADATRCALKTRPEDIVSSGVAIDMAALFHETQYTRLFRS
ncbi:MAG: urease accessory protein UreF [Alphaproteobacteria bacterium]|nr:urease accessory protein UreF [Alphaproteobacteria bacterium]MBO6864385.1 urease accessory protein UreF [Alphaproteobacteria bacterium]